MNMLGQRRHALVQLRLYSRNSRNVEQRSYVQCRFRNLHSSFAPPYSPQRRMPGYCTHAQFQLSSSARFFSDLDKSDERSSKGSKEVATTDSTPSSFSSDPSHQESYRKFFAKLELDQDNNAKYNINRFYRDEIRLTGNPCYYRVRLFNQGDHSLASGKCVAWHAEFVCPVTNTVYPAGKLRDTECAYASAGSVVYRQKGTACEAAASRALDALRYTFLGKTEPRLCEEDPSDPTEKKVFTSETLESLKTSDHSTPHPRVVEAEKEYPHEDVGDVIDVSGRAFSVEGVDSEDDDSDGEEMQIVQIKTTAAQAPSNRILESIASSRTVTRNEPGLSQRSPLPSEAFRRLQKAVKDAGEWAKRVSFYDRRKTKRPLLTDPLQTANNLLSGKILMANLARANQNIPFISENVGVERAARNVLNALWKVSDTGPDVQDYNSFLRCLQGQTPKKVAEKAEGIVDEMKLGIKKGKMTPPKPDKNTTNTLIQLWAQVGGTGGRYEKLEDDFIPNRESFLSILSSCVYHTSEARDWGGFDVDFAEQCIRRMKELNETNPSDDALALDIDIYNAPLRWAGGPRWEQSRSYARYVPWDRYQDIFERGFEKHNETAPLWKEAAAMEQWMRTLENKRTDTCAPNVETFEACIQAWVRTGTQEGVENAEHLLEEILSRRGERALPLRLQSFHPVFAAWLHSRSPLNVSRTQYWIDRLEAEAVTNPSISPDDRIYENLMTTHLNHQSSLISRNSQDAHDSADKRKSIVASAQACTKTLDKISKMAENNDTPAFVLCLEASPYVSCIKAWQNVALSGSNDEEVRHGLDEIFVVSRRFEDILAQLADLETSDRRVGNEPLQVSLRLNQLLSSAHLVFIAVVSAIRKICEKKDIVEVSLPVLERMVRVTGELFELEIRIRGSDTEDGENRNKIPLRLMDRDRFVYGPVNGFYENDSSKTAFLWQVIEFIKACPLSRECNEDIFRLSSVVKQLAADGSPRMRGELDEIVLQKARVLVSKQNKKAGGVCSFNIATDSQRQANRISQSPRSRRSSRRRRARSPTNRNPAGKEKKAQGMKMSGVN